MHVILSPNCTSSDNHLKWLFQLQCFRYSNLTGLQQQKVEKNKGQIELHKDEQKPAKFLTAWEVEGMTLALK